MKHYPYSKLTYMKKTTTIKKIIIIIITIPKQYCFLNLKK